MICDRLDDIGLYRDMNKNLDTAIDFILSHDLDELPLGKTVVDGEKVFANCMECDTALASDKLYEMHRNYMDIQIDLRGTERVLTGDRSAMDLELVDPQTDICFGEAPMLSDCCIGPGRFIICMTGEPHMPGVAVEKPEPIKKCVFKVHI